MSVMGRAGINGQRCPNCKEVCKYPPNTWGEIDDVPHDNLLDCIKYLAKEVERINNTLEDHRL